MTATSASWIGAVLSAGRYQVTRVLGEGGMGVAYLGWDRRLETEVVIKVPHRHLLSSPEVVQRFMREIRSLVALSHPHVVRVSDVAEHEGIPFSVLQYLSGGSLDDRLKRLPLNASLAQRCELLASWFEPIAQALDFVHQNGCVHRDVKPANILFDKHGNAYLADFGVAKTLADQQQNKQSTALTGAGMVLGTPDYMAPELITANQFDGRVDQYALAFTAFESLTGRLPLSAASPTAMMVAHATQRPAYLGDVLPHLPRGVSDAIARGMAKNPHDRHAKCRDLAVAVTTILRATPREALSAPVQDTARKEPVRLSCPACQQVLRVPEQLAGQRVPCSKCRTPLWVAPDLHHLEVVVAGAGPATVYSALPHASLTPTTSSPTPTIPIADAPPRAVPYASTMAVPTAAPHLPASSWNTAVDEPAGLPTWAWALIGAGSGLAVLAVMYLTLFAGGTKPATDTIASRTPAATDKAAPLEAAAAGTSPSVDANSAPVTPAATTVSEPSSPATVSPTTPNTGSEQLAPRVGANVAATAPDGPASTTTPAGRSQPTMPSPTESPSPTPTTRATGFPGGPFAATSAPAPQVASPTTKTAADDAPTTTPVSVRPTPSGPLAKLPSAYSLPDRSNDRPTPALLGELDLKTGDAIELKLLTQIEGLKARRTPSSLTTSSGTATNAPTSSATISIAPKKDFRVELSPVSGAQRWNIVAKEAGAATAAKSEPDMSVGEFFVESGKLNFRWQPNIEDAVADALRNAVLHVSCGTVTHGVQLRGVLRESPLKIDLTQTVQNVKLTEAKGLPPKEAIWFEILSTTGFPSGTTFDPADKRAQGRKFKIMLNLIKPEVRVDIDMTVSPSGAALRFEPQYEVQEGNTAEELTLKHIKTFDTIDAAISNNINLLESLDRNVSNLRFDLASVRVSDPTNINEVQAANAARARINGAINSAVNKHRNTTSLLARLRAIREALPVLQSSLSIHQRAEIRYRMFYVVEGHEVDVMRAE